MKNKMLHINTINTLIRLYNNLCAYLLPFLPGWQLARRMLLYIMCTSVPYTCCLYYSLSVQVTIDIIILQTQRYLPF